MQELEGKISAATLSADDIAPDRSESPEKEDGRAVLDDIDWKVVAEKVPTRSRTQCMDKWYRRLAPSMVTRGVSSTHSSQSMSSPIHALAPLQGPPRMVV